MMNAIPFLGWFISIIINLSLAVPFWFCWTYLHIGSKYFYFLPDVYKGPSFLDCAFLFITVSILKVVLTPRSVVLNNTNTIKK